MQNAEEECGMPEQRRELRLNAASGNGFAILPTQFCSRDPSPTRLSPLLPNPAFLFCILHRGEIPHPAFISPLCIPSPHPSALVCETCSTLTSSSPSRHSAPWSHDPPHPRFPLLKQAPQPTLSRTNSNARVSCF